MSQLTSPASHRGAGGNQTDVEDESTTQSKRMVRNYIACRRCHTQKVKCSGDTPCRNCKGSKTPVECIYPVRDRKVAVSERYLKKLEGENEDLKRKSPWPESSTAAEASTGGRAEPNHPQKRSMTSKSPNLPDLGTQSSREQTTLNGPTISEENIEATMDETGIIPYVGEAACTTFGSKLRQFLLGEDTPPAPRRPRYYTNQKMLRASYTDCHLPNRSDAQLLVRVVLRFIGPDYHLLRRKSFLERLEETYKLEVFNDPIWLCRLFTVFALGEIYTVRSTKPRGNGVPGISFFLKALEFFQDLYEEPTVEYIETLLLLSFYSTTLNRRNTSYTYIGLAMRLSMMLGLHRKIPANATWGPSEREHRIRVWWTVYCLDRMMSSKLGHPAMIQDTDIDADLPSFDGLSPQDTADFYDPAYLLAQISLARIVGNVLGNIYHIPHKGRTNTFVQGVQNILANLRTFRSSLPPLLRLDPNNSPMYANRTVASLHLHFNQCVILTTRPILFYVFRQKFTQQTETSTSPRTIPHMITVLSDACVQTARTSNQILSQLWVDGCLAMYGFYDALSIFSSTLVLMISSAMDDPGAKHNVDTDAIGLAWSLLRSMKDDGNLPASDYYDQLVQLKDVLEDACAKKIKSSKTGPDSSNSATHLLPAAPTVEGAPMINDIIIPRGSGPLPPICADGKNGVGAVDTLNHQLLDGIWAQPQGPPQGQATWAPVAWESMFNTSATDQPLWDFDWASLGML